MFCRRIISQLLWLFTAGTEITDNFLVSTTSASVHEIFPVLNIQLMYTVELLSRALDLH